MIDDKNASLMPSMESPRRHLKTAIAPQVLTVICKHQVKVHEEDLADETLLVFLQGYAKTSLHNLTFLGAEIHYKMNLKPFDRVENLACQCERLSRPMAYTMSLRPREGKRSGDK